MHTFILLILLSFNFVFAATTKHYSGVFLGEAKLYHSAISDRKVSVIMMRIGEAKDRRFLLSFKIPGNEMNQKTFIYKEKCDTPTCQQSTYIQEGGSRRSILSDKMFKKRHLKVLLPNESQNISIYYDSHNSENISRSNLYDKYRQSIYDDLKFSEIKKLLAKSVKDLNELCRSNIKLSIDNKSFEKAHKKQLLGRAIPMLDEITKTCKDEMYREVFSSLKTIILSYNPQYKNLALNEKNELILYISSDIYNPSAVAKKAINKL